MFFYLHHICLSPFPTKARPSPRPRGARATASGWKVANVGGSVSLTIMLRGAQERLQWIEDTAQALDDRSATTPGRNTYGKFLGSRRRLLLKPRFSRTWN